MDDRKLEMLIARTAGGDVQALHGLYTELSGTVFALTRAILQDRSLAEDALQDTFVKVRIKAHTYRPGSRPRPWVLAIARNTAYTALRSRRREIPTEPDTSRPGGQAETSDTVALNLAMASLEPQAREIVLLGALEGFTHREIASILGIPAGSISWKYRKAMDSLKQQLSEQVGG